MTLPISKLGSQAKILMGQSPPGSSYNSDGIGVPLLNGPTEFGPVHPIAQQWTTAPTKMCQPKDILFCVRGATAGRINIADGHYCIGRGLAAIRPTPGKFSDRFLHHVLNTGYHKFQAMGVGSTFINISGEMLSNFEVPLLSFVEQVRVAAILDDTENLMRKRHQITTSLESLGGAFFEDLFGDPVLNPYNWTNKVLLGDVANIVSGVTKGRPLKGRSSRPVPYLAVVNVQDKSLWLDTVKSFDATEEEIKRYALRRDDLLLTEGGDPDKLGRGTLWSEELPECIHQNHIFRVRITDDRVHPVYLNWLVGSSYGKNYFLKSAKQTTGIASINMTQLRQLPLLLPPLSLQLKFAKLLAKLNDLISASESAEREMVALFASLQHRAFSGELTVGQAERELEMAG